MPAIVALQETVAVPDPVRLVGLIAPQTRPEGTFSVSDTVPAKWFSEVTVMVEVADTPTLTAAGEEAVVVKSRNWNRAVAVRTREALVPVKVKV